MKMSPEHERHLSRIIFKASELIEAKYRAGQKEHGGNLWEKDNLLDEAINEAVDLVVYLLSEKERRSKSLDKIITEHESLFTQLKDK